MAGFTVKAPAPGMVIYYKDWNGKKRTTGSQVSSWDPTVATLPDLTQMESVTYVNEIDVRKVSVGQHAKVSLDADPTKKLTGTVTAVANVGEQRPNTDAKVFEVKLVIDQPDTTLRPGMTTGNGIEISREPNALFIPLEAVNSENGVPFVYQQSGTRLTKQEIETSSMSDDEVIVTRGLVADDRVMLTPPHDHDGMVLARLPGSTAGVKAGGDTAPSPTPLPVHPDSAQGARTSAKPSARKT
jgi:hypothetical protein